MPVFHLAGAASAILVPAVLTGYAFRRYGSQPAVVRWFVAAAAVWLVGLVGGEFGAVILRSTLQVGVSTGTLPLSWAMALSRIPLHLGFTRAIELGSWIATGLLLLATARIHEERRWRWRVICLLPLSAVGLLLGHWIDRVGPTIHVVDVADIVGDQNVRALMQWELTTSLGSGAVLFWCIWYAGLFGGKSALAQENCTAGT